MSTECKGCKCYSANLRDGYCVECRGCERCGCCSVTVEWVDCNWGCDEGAVDAYDEDPINESPGTFVSCSNCDGIGGWEVVRCLGDCDDNGKHVALAGRGGR